MARTADHDARRAQVVAGVRSLALEVGLGRVTLAGAAQAAGVSVGLVQHYYSTKEELLQETFRSVRSDVLRRVEASVVRGEQRQQRIEQMLLAGLEQTLPLDPRRRQEVYLVHAFAGLALENQALRVALGVAQEELVTRAEVALENGKRCGEVAPGTESRPAAYALLALAEGLSARLLVAAGRQHRSWARGALAAEVSRLCCGECRHHRGG